MNTNFFTEIKNLTIFHRNKCKIYQKILDNDKIEINSIRSIKDIPFLHVRMFKEYNLKSVKKNDVHKILHSSGTSGLSSKIFLDKINAQNQSKALANIFVNKFGNERIPFIFVDENPLMKKNFKFNARAAAIFGFSIFANKKFFLLKDGKIDYEGLNSFFKKTGNKKICIFGFTSQIFEHLLEKENINLINFNLKNSFIIHGGGWKKIEKKKITKKVFNDRLKKLLKVDEIYNYYGLVEQIGSIFFDCPKCLLYSENDYSKVLIRDKNFKLSSNNQKGLVQLLSKLPTSYPGHSILTEDYGKIIQRKKCSCSSSNKKRFDIYGRANQSDPRGCSDVR